MKEELTIKQIQEAKAELEEKISELFDDFEKKYLVKIDRVYWNDFIRFGERDMVRAKVELRL